MLKTLADRLQSKRQQNKVSACNEQTTALKKELKRGRPISILHVPKCQHIHAPAAGKTLRSLSASGACW
jgi:hypothetical protein